MTNKELEQIARRLTEKQKASLILIAQHEGLPLTVNPHVRTQVIDETICVNAIIRNSLRRLWLIDAKGITESGLQVARYLQNG